MDVVSSLGNQVLLEMHQDDGHEGFGEEEAVLQFACKCLPDDGLTPLSFTDT